jgi:hypothetical protein
MKTVVVVATCCQAELPYTFISSLEVSKNKAPVSNVPPSLSAVGFDDFGPKYLSSKES